MLRCGDHDRGAATAKTLGDESGHRGGETCFLRVKRNHMSVRRTRRGIRNARHRRNIPRAIETQTKVRVTSRTRAKLAAEYLGRNGAAERKTGSHIADHRFTVWNHDQSTPRSSKVRTDPSVEPHGKGESSRDGARLSG